MLNNPSILSIWDLSLEIFKANIINNRMVQTRCVNGILMIIERERNGELIDRSLVQNLLNMLQKLQVSLKTLLNDLLTSHLVSLQKVAVL